MKKKKNSVIKWPPRVTKMSDGIFSPHFKTVFFKLFMMNIFPAGAFLHLEGQIDVGSDVSKNLVFFFALRIDQKWHQYGGKMSEAITFQPLGRWSSYSTKSCTPILISVA